MAKLNLTITGAENPRQAAAKIRKIQQLLRRELTDLEKRGVIPWDAKQKAIQAGKAIAVMRGAKLASTSSAGAHNFREMEVVNARKRADGSHDIRHVEGYPTSVKAMKARIKARLAETKPTDNGDPVKTIEIIVAMPPGWFERMNRKKRWAVRSFGNKVQRWIERQFGRENVMAMTWHMDEETPHLHAIILPLVYKVVNRGRPAKDPSKARSREPEWIYSAKTWFGSPREKEPGTGQVALANRQDEFWAEVASDPEFELERGEKGSKRRHQAPRDFYAGATKAHRVAERLDAILPGLDHHEQDVAALDEGWEKLKAVERRFAQRNIDLNVRISDWNFKEAAQVRRAQALDEREAGIQREVDGRVEAAVAEASAEAAKIIAEANEAAAKIREVARVAGEAQGRQAIEAQRQQLLADAERDRAEAAEEKATVEARVRGGLATEIAAAEAAQREAEDAKADALQAHARLIPDLERLDRAEDAIAEAEAVEKTRDLQRRQAAMIAKAQAELAQHGVVFDEHGTIMKLVRASRKVEAKPSAPIVSQDRAPTPQVAIKPEAAVAAPVIATVEPVKDKTYWDGVLTRQKGETTSDFLARLNRVPGACAELDRRNAEVDAKRGIKPNPAAPSPQEQYAAVRRQAEEAKRRREHYGRERGQW